MKKLFKCSVCNFVFEGDAAPEICPKCGATHEKFNELSIEDAEKVYKSERTNDIHMEIISLVDKIVDLSDEGIDLNLDPACVSAFEKAVNEAYIIKQRAKAELENHMKKGKW
jgi:rubredoxin